MKRIFTKTNIEPPKENNGGQDKNDQDKNGQNNNQGQGPRKPMPRKKPSVMSWVLIGLLVFLLVMMIISMFGPTYHGISITGDSSGWFLHGVTDKAGVAVNNFSTLLKGDEVDYYQYSSLVKVIIHIDGGENYIAYVSQPTWNGILSTLGSSPASVVPKSTSGNPFINLIITLLPWVVILGGTYWIMTKVMKSQGSIGNMNKKSLSPQMSDVKFKDVAGYDEVKAELWEIVDFLKNPKKYQDVGARTPKGVMLSGPPGTGKTFLAKAVAGEAGIPFFSLSGSDFVEMFVGVGAKRVRELFAQTKAVAPALIFIDELDAVGRQRGAGMGGGNDEREQTLNQLLVEMDGFASNTGIVVIAATNRPDVLDPALKRPGRFDRSIEFRLPDILERQAILEIYAKQGGKSFEENVAWENIAGRTPGFSAAELENVVNEAAILSIRLKKSKISLDIIDEAIDRVIGGPSKSNNLMSDEEKKLIAYHESGHALVGLALENAEKVQKITIIPRGQAGGYVLMTPKKEKFVQTKSELLAKVTSYMAGRASEEFFFGASEITTGAYSDIESATQIARRMVTEFGMSDLGPIQYEKPSGNVFLGRDYSNSSRNYSGQLAHEIDKEVRKIIDASYSEASILIKKHKPLMDLLAEALLIKETLTSEEAQFIWENKKLPEQVENMKFKKVKVKKPAVKKTSTTINKPKVEEKALNKKEIK